MGIKIKRLLCAVMTFSLTLGMSASLSTSIAVTKGKDLESDLKVYTINSFKAAGRNLKDSDIRKKTPAAKFGELPKKFDLREEGYVTPVKLQAPFGTCWAFGVCAASEISILSRMGLTNEEYKNKYGEELDISEKQVAYWAYHPVLKVDPIYPAQVGEGSWLMRENTASDAYSQGGFMGQTSFMFASGAGPSLESSDPKNYPYEFYDKDGNRCYAVADAEKVVESSWKLQEGTRFHSDFKVKDINYLPSSAITKYEDKDGTREEVYVGYDPVAVAAVKSELLNGRGVSLTYHGDHSMPDETGKYSPHFSYENWAQYDDENVDTNHCVTIVGWDDNYKKEKFKATVNPGHALPKGDGAWIVKNSWGDASWSEITKSDHEKWGINQSGYFYLSYYDHSISTFETLDFDLSDKAMNQEERIEQYDNMMPLLTALFSNDNLALESGSSPLRMSNVFEAQTDENLQSVGVSILYPNTRYSIDVYRHGKNAKVTNPESGEHLIHQAESSLYAGFHKIELRDSFHFDKGEKYSVVLTELSSEDGIPTYLAHTNLSISKTMAEEQDYGFYAEGIINPGESFIYHDGIWEDMVDKMSEYTYDGYLSIDNFHIKSYLVELKTNTVKVSTSKKTVKESALKKKAKTVSPITVKNARGKVSYKLVSGTAKAKKALSLNTKTGKITVKKGTKKGTYKLKVKVSCAGNKSYKSASDTVTVTIQVK